MSTSRCRAVLLRGACWPKRGGDGEDQVAYRAGARHVPRLERRTPASGIGRTRQRHQPLVIGATGNIGPHLIQQLADMGAGTIVAVSRNPGSRLDELADGTLVDRDDLITVAADATDETAMAALFDRFGTELPALGASTWRRSPAGR